MNNSKRIIDVICFSGTGNTRFITEKLTDSLSVAGFDIRNIDITLPYVHNTNHEILLAFPVNSQSVSPYILKYFIGLPDGNGDKVHILLTMNQSAAILSPLKRLLINKHYCVMGTAEISIPNNLLIASKEDTTYRDYTAQNEAPSQPF